MDELEALLETYWGCAYDEGREDRNHDREDGRAGETLNAIRSLFSKVRAAALEEAAAEVDAEMLHYGRLHPTPPGDIVTGLAQAGICLRRLIAKTAPEGAA